ncbi:hypothetical protein Poly41_27190 [Novipirellula artificiosorum]|uniref:Uncharacterized protein n=1 Tax=Novipirellula artificiosorum TaxID=2528016 RepID=A0A5C6DLG7_9BACT|nr:hypothetical protein Poly41_27190 [Novipirellula artificiosorum]
MGTGALLRSFDDRNTPPCWQVKSFVSMLDRSVRALHPTESFDEARMQFNAVKTDGVRGQLDPTEPVGEPLADGAEHWMVMTEGVVAERPVFP